MDNFHQGEKYSSQIAIHQAELRREENFTYQKSLSVSFLQTDYINIDSSSGCGKNNEGENIVHTKCTICGGANHSSENFSKGSERKMKKPVRLVIRTTNIWNARLANVLDVDLNIIKLQNFQSHLKITRNGESKYVSVKEVIVHRKKEFNNSENNNDQ